MGQGCLSDTGSYVFGMGVTFVFDTKKGMGLMGVVHGMGTESTYRIRRTTIRPEQPCNKRGVYDEACEVR